jgi:hypothetical protein
VGEAKALEYPEEKTTARAKCGGLSTARRTMKLSVASVEMTLSYAEQKNDALVEQKKEIRGRVKNLCVLGDGKGGWR